MKAFQIQELMARLERNWRGIWAGSFQIPATTAAPATRRSPAAQFVAEAKYAEGRLERLVRPCVGCTGAEARAAGDRAIVQVCSPLILGIPRGARP